MGEIKSNIPPPPVVVLGGKLEISQSDGDKGGDYEENNEDDEQDAVYGVNPVTPHAGKDVIKLNVYGAERQETRHGHLRDSAPVPRQRWDFSRVLCGSHRSLELGFAVLSGDPAEDQQRGCHEGPD